MDHQVEHDVDVGAARLERREAMRLDETRRAELALERDDGRIEAFEVTDLQHATHARGRRHELARLVERLGDRLFDEHVDAVLETAHGDRVVQRRGRRDADRIDVAEQLAEIRDGPAAGFAGHALARRRVGIDHGDQLRSVGTGIFLGMETPQIPHSDDRSSHF